MQRIDGRKNAHDKPKKEYPLTTTKRSRRGDKGGTVERIYWGIMVSKMSRDSAAQTLHNISRDMGRCILHLLFFGAFLRCINGGRAITQFPRHCPRGEKWAIINSNQTLNSKNRKESKP